MSPLVLLVLAADLHRLDSRREPGAESCPDEQALQRAVAERLGVSPFTPDAQRTVTVRWRSQAGTFSSELSVTNEAGTLVGSKRLTSNAKDCADLASSTALALALIIDPMSLTRPPEPPAAPDVTPPPAPPTMPAEQASAPPIVVVERAPEAPPSKTAMWLGGGAGFSLFEVPNVSAALELDLAWTFSLLMLGAKVSVVAPGSSRFDEGSVWAVVIGAGPFLCLGSSRVGGCAALRLGATHAWPSGFSAGTSSGTALSVAISLGPYVDFAPSESMKVRLFANAQLQPAAAALVVRNTVAWRTPIFAFSAGVSLFGSP